ncbi:hypothetical protein HUU05_21100 [candidate division KSB1 bacterium]|nr:hypothetical protein [candidate division KSB1 bacterium]
MANANRSLDEITAPIGGYLNSIAQKRHQKVKNLLAEWRVMIEIWDLRKGYKKGNNENEEMGFSRIADRLHLKDLDTDKAGRLFRRMDRVIQACTSKKWPGAMYEKGRGVHPI